MPRNSINVNSQDHMMDQLCQSIVTVDSLKTTYHVILPGKSIEHENVTICSKVTSPAAGVGISPCVAYMGYRCTACVQFPSTPAEGTTHPYVTLHFLVGQGSAGAGAVAGRQSKTVSRI